MSLKITHVVVIINFAAVVTLKVPDIAFNLGDVIIILISADSLCI